MTDQFEPVIIGFTCNWCSYRAADLAGTARVKYPPNVRLIRLMCSGRLDPTFVIKALAEGADGVMITKPCAVICCLPAPWKDWGSNLGELSWYGPAPPKASDWPMRSQFWSKKCALWVRCTGLSFSAETDTRPGSPRMLRR
jgi:hypothetical protein